MSASLITNHKDNNHLKQIKKLFAESDEIWMATAFLKMSGLNQILPLIRKHIKDGKSINIIAGQNFGLTEPDALNQLMILFDNKPNARLNLAHFNKSFSVFHPKLYLFIKSKSCTIISGSANITSGGLIGNVESSLKVEAAMSESVSIETFDFLKMLFTSEYSLTADSRAINRYQTYFEKMRKYNKGMRKIVPPSVDDENFEKLYKEFVKFNNSGRKKKHEEKLNDYKDALFTLNKIAKIERINKVNFEILLDDLVTWNNDHEPYWKSNGLFRGKNTKNGNPAILSHGKEFQKLISFVKQNHHKEVSVVFDMGKDIINEIPGAGVNYLTEMLMTFNCKKYANLNSNPLTVLNKKAGMDLKKSANNYTGEEYKVYCEIVKDFIDEYKLEDYLEADSFFNSIFQSLKHKNKTTQK